MKSCNFVVMKKILLSICVFSFVLLVFGQEKQAKAPLFLEPETHIAFVVPNYGAAPSGGLCFAQSLSLGWQTQKDSSWQAYYGYPQTGIQFRYLQTGNLNELGSQYSLNPFITFNKAIGSKSKHSLDFKLGLGVAYHTNPYDTIENPSNKAVGSAVSWFFEANMYYRYALSKRIHLKVGGGFWHASNGHTALPNFGQNYAAFGVGLQYYSGLENEFVKYDNAPAVREKHFYLKANYAIGLQEYGSTTGPKNGPMYKLSSSTVSGAMLFRKFLLVKAGFNYRYYETFAKSYERNQFPDFEGTKTQAASNLIFFMGTELMWGHVSLDVQGGLNLWKPYFPHFYDHYEDKSGFDRTMKVLFNTQVGVNLYLLNTAKLPKHNVSVGAYINTNYGQADFVSMGVGYTYRVK